MHPPFITLSLIAIGAFIKSATLPDLSPASVVFFGTGIIAAVLISILGFVGHLQHT